MHQDVIRAEVIALTRRIEDELPDTAGLHAAAAHLREIIANIGNREHDHV
jgi:hypothetical protein